MSDGPSYRVPFRRRREGRTDYRYRLRLLLGGSPRAVVRVTHGRIRVAVTSFHPQGDRVIAAAESAELSAVGLSKAVRVSTPASYLTGYLAGIRAKAAGTQEAVLDAGLRHPSPGGRIQGALKGLLDAGLAIPHGEAGLPSSDRLKGSHLRTPLPEPLEVYKQKLAGLAPRNPRSA